jgi:hypothetical protein
MHWYESQFFPDATELVQQFEHWREILLDQANIALFSSMVTTLKSSMLN